MLRIAVWPKGKDAGRARRWTLRCKPVGGSHPRAVGACRALAEHAEALAPLPRMTICTQIYGGPQVAEVTGTLEGKAVRATVTRADGCQIDRWNRLRPLFLIGS